MAIHVVLYQPENPANTGNIARTCAATGSILHLIRPLGFSTDDKMMKRAGLDYWAHVKLIEHDSLDDFYQRYEGGEFFYLTKNGSTPHTTFDYSQPDKDYFFIFGKETAGLPPELVEKNQDRALRIPMLESSRSLNLSNAAAVLIYEAQRQQGYPALN